MTLNQRFATKAYANIGIQTRGVQHDPYELAMLMFEAVIENATAARGAMEAGNVLLKVQHLHKAVRVLQDGLRTSLDLENGGELAQNLANLYDYCILRLTQANAQNDVAAVAEVIELIKPVADAWRQMRNTTPAATESDSWMADEAPAKPSIPPAARRVSHAYSAGLSLQGA